MSDEILGAPELANLLKCGEDTALQLLATGQIKGCKPGRAWITTTSAVLAYIKKESERTYRERPGK